MALQICYFVPGNLLNPTQSFNQRELMLLSQAVGSNASLLQAACCWPIYAQI